MRGLHECPPSYWAIGGCDVHRLSRVVAFSLLAALMTACGTRDRVETTDPTTTTKEPMTLTTMVPATTTTSTTIDPLGDALAFVVAVFEYAGAVTRTPSGEQAPAPGRTSTGGVSMAPTQGVSAPAPGLEPCGGDLPPCWVKDNESGGNYAAVNWGGCDGHNCYGAWQFSGAWACQLGLPCDLATATTEQQDAAARQLWDGGAGCGNWAAC